MKARRLSAALTFPTAALALALPWIGPLAVPVASGQAAEAVDLAAILRIRDEGMNRSQVMDTVFWLTDRYGPRLNGSLEFEEAGEWTVKQLQSWGITNVRKERFPAGPGWSLLGFHATMIEPRVMPMVGMPAAGSPATSGVVTADVVRPIIRNPQDAVKYRGTLHGKIVLTQPARDVRMLDQGDGTVLRYDDQDGRWRREAMDLPRPVPPAARAASPPPQPQTPPAAPFNVEQFYRDEGVIAMLDRGPTSDLAAGGSNLSWTTQRVDGGTIVAQEVSGAGLLPQVTLAVEHYNRMVRLLDRNIPVKVELLVSARVTPETRPGSFNIVGEIPGTDKADEIVLLGAHFDSWHGGTGATDNAAGVAAMMEALRIIRAAGLRPRRTIRLGLWGDEESGFVGSQTYVREHVGTAAAPGPEHARTVAYFNLDNGTGRIRGIWTQGNARAREVFETWSRPLVDLGVDLISPRSVGQTDHVPFDRAGIPAFQFVQERYEYNSRTHHTTMDVYDRVQPDDVKQMAVVAAIFAWQTAAREMPLPRRASGQ